MGTAAFGFGVLAIVMVVYLLILGIGIASYVMNSLALHKIADRRGIQNPWLAWIPFANYWIIGSIADEYDAHNGLQRKWKVVLLALALIYVGGFVLMYIFMFVFIFAIIGVAESGSEPTAAFFSTLLGFYVILVVIMLIAMAFNALYTICMYKIFESTVPEKAVKYMLLSLLVPLGCPICLMLCRNQGYSVPKPQPVYAYPAMPVPPVEQPDSTDAPMQHTDASDETNE